MLKLVAQVEEATMQPHGMEEEKAVYLPEDPRLLIGQIRRLGSAGPAYEIMKIDDDQNVMIEVIESGEQVVFPLSEILEDPMAETIP
jgi:hypothetical protein